MDTLTYLHDIESKPEGEMYDYEKHCHLNYVFPFSDGTKPKGYVVIYDRMNCKNSVTFAEVVVTYDPYDEKDIVVFGFGDYNALSATDSVTDEKETVRYDCICIDCADDTQVAIEEGEHIAKLLSKSFMDAWLHVSTYIDGYLKTVGDIDE